MTLHVLTVRDYLVAIRDRHRVVVNGMGVICGCREGCAGTWPCPDHSDASAALAIFDACNAVSQETIPVGVPTPGRYRLVFDPAADDEPLTREQRWAEAIIEGRYPESSA